MVWFLLNEQKYICFSEWPISPITKWFAVNFVIEPVGGASLQPVATIGVTAAVNNSVTAVTLPQQPIASGSGHHQTVPAAQVSMRREGIDKGG